MTAQELPLPEPDPQDVLQRADTILSRSEYRTTESVLDRAGQWLDDALSRVFSELSGGGVGAVVGWVVLLALVALVLWLVVRMRPMAGVVRVEGKAATVETSADAALAPRAASDWRHEAELLAAAGRYDEALLARYRAVVADLIQHGVLDDIPGRTAGEYRQDVLASVPPIGAPFSELTNLFEAAWYGPAAATAPDLGRFDEHERTVLAGIAT